MSQTPGTSITFEITASHSSELVVFAIRSSSYASGSAELILDGNSTGIRLDAHWRLTAWESSVQPFRLSTGWNYMPTQGALNDGASRQTVIAPGHHRVGFRILASTRSPQNVTLFAVVALALLPVVQARDSKVTTAGSSAVWAR